MRQDATLGSVLLRPLVQVVEAIPGGLDGFWQATGLRPEVIADKDARVTPIQFAAAWSEALRVTKDPELPLRLAETIPAGTFGLVEYLCCSAPTLGEGLRQWVRYLSILDDAAQVGLLDQGDRESVRVLIESFPDTPASHELCFALTVRNARALLGPKFIGFEVRFSHAARSSNVARYNAFFGTDVVFGAEFTELIVPKSVLAEALPTADAGLLDVLVPLAEEKRARSVTNATLTDRVRKELRSALSNDDAQLDRMAERLGLTGRSLQRRLKEEGTSFQGLRDEIRRTLADRYLAQGLSVPEISFLLGFSEPSVFFRAFKRWTGSTPFERESQGVAPA